MLIWSAGKTKTNNMGDANDGKYLFDFCGIIFYGQFSTNPVTSSYLR